MLCVWRVSAVQYNENTSETKLYVNDKEIYLSSIKNYKTNLLGTSWPASALAFDETRKHKNKTSSQRSDQTDRVDGTDESDGMDR